MQPSVGSVLKPKPEGWINNNQKTENFNHKAENIYPVDLEVETMLKL